MPTLNDIIRQLERIPTPNKITIGGRPEMIIGGKPIRIGVYTDDFEKLKRALEK